MDALSKYAQPSYADATPEDFFSQDGASYGQNTFNPAPPPPVAPKSGGVAQGAMSGAASGAATGNPYVIGGLAAMGALSAGLERQRAERDARYQSVLNKMSEQSKAVGNAAQFASRISY